MTSSRSAALASLKNEALVIADTMTGPVAKISRNVAVELGQKYDITYRLAHVDELYADADEREMARDIYEAEFSQPIDLLYGLARSVSKDELGPVNALLDRAKELGVTAFVAVVEEVSLN